MTSATASHSARDLFSLIQGPLRRVFAATLINALGNGMTLTLFVVYLTQVRGLRIGQATGLLATMSVLSFICSPLSGTLIDRFGPRRLLMFTVPAMAIGVTAIGHIRSFQDALMVGIVTSVAGSGNWSAFSTLVSQMVSEDKRQRVFGLNFMILNFGIGAGGLISASIVKFEDPSTFELLYLIDGCSFLLVWSLIISLRGYGGPSPAAVDASGKEIASRGWSFVLRDKLLLRYMLAALLLVVCGYGNMEAGLSYFVTTTVGLPVSKIGIILAANTAAIVAAQVFVLARIQGRSRSRLLMFVGLLWAVSWVLAAASAFVHPLAALVILCAGQVVFALGETIWAPVAPAMVNDMAADDVRGRYNSAQSLLWTVAGTIAPMVAGAFLQRGQGFLWLASLVAGCVLAAVVFADLRHRVGAKVDGLEQTPSPNPVAATPGT